MKIELSKIKPSPDNAMGRSEITPKMEELIATIKALGIVEPVTVIPKNGKYEIIEGERRWFAAKQAGLKEIEAYVREDVSDEQARLMRLASLSHEDWAYEEFADRVWKEIETRDITYAELAKLTGLSYGNISNAFNFQLGKMAGCVVEFDGEVKAQSTALIYRTFTIDTDVRASKKRNRQIQDYAEATTIPNILEIQKALANKASEDKIVTVDVQKLCARMFKALPNIVTFGEPDDKDYEVHNFEVDAILRVEWGIQNYETEVKYIAEGIAEAERKRWEAARFDEAAMKKFTDALIAWKKAIKEVNRTKEKFSPEAAQFCANGLEEIREVEDSILSYFEEKAKELQQ